MTFLIIITSVREMSTSNCCLNSNTYSTLATPKWNCQPLLSSQDLGWNGIQLDRYRHDPYVLPRHSYSQYLLKIFLSEGEIRRSLKDEERLERVAVGDVAIIPPRTHYQASWRDEIEFILLSLHPDVFQKLAQGKIQYASAEIQPQFAVKDPLILGITTTLKTQLECDRHSCGNYAGILADAIAIHLLKKYSVVTATNNSDSCEAKLQIVLDYIEQNLEEKLSLDAIASQVNLSKYYLCRLFTQHLNISPRQHIIQRRIIKAKQLLKQERSMQVVDIAYECGFASHSHFNRQFNKSVGMSPKAYRYAE